MSQRGKYLVFYDTTSVLLAPFTGRIKRSSTDRGLCGRPIF
jgi:hypothetical protein